MRMFTVESGNEIEIKPKTHENILQACGGQDPGLPWREIASPARDKAGNGWARLAEKRSTRCFPGLEAWLLRFNTG
jgi:hypothetical protein